MTAATLIDFTKLLKRLTGQGLKKNFNMVSPNTYPSSQRFIVKVQSELIFASFQLVIPLK
jgi:hypothetical protein